MRREPQNGVQKGVAESGNVSHKGPRVGTCWVCLRERKKGSLAVAGEMDRGEAGEVTRIQVTQGPRAVHGRYAKCPGSQWRDLNVVVTWHYLLLKKVILMVKGHAQIHWSISSLLALRSHVSSYLPRVMALGSFCFHLPKYYPSFRNA